MEIVALKDTLKYKSGRELYAEINTNVPFSAFFFKRLEGLRAIEGVHFQRIWQKNIRGKPAIKDYIITDELWDLIKANAERSKK